MDQSEPCVAATSTEVLQPQPRSQLRRKNSQTSSTDSSVDVNEKHGSNIHENPKIETQQRSVESASKVLVSSESDDPYNPPIEDDALEYTVTIPELCEGSGHDPDKHVFSWRKLWAFMGPGFLMSIAYLDPGNIESDLRSGAVAQYRLLWVLLLAHILGFFLQRLSARLGVTSGRNLAEMAHEFYPKAPRLFVWLMIEIAIIGSDMQEVIGTAIAFSLLSGNRIPLFAGVLITIVDTLTFLMIDRYGFRKLELLFALLISVMAASFGYEFLIMKPDIPKVLEGTFFPICPGCDQKVFMQAVSVVGAVIMPHNLYLHSALVKSRRIDRSRRQKVSEANFYYFIESGFALICSFFINLFVVAVFAHGLFQKTNADIFNLCQNSDIPDTSLFPNNTEFVDADIYKGGIFLGCKFGHMALIVWGIGIMAAGQSSTMTGTYAGQYVMEGFLHILWPRWRRVFVTRAIAIGPTLFVALMARGVENLTKMNDFLNCVQMIQLPFAILPVLTFVSHPAIMFEFRAARWTKLCSLLVSLLVIAINLYFSSDYIIGELGAENWYSWFILIGFGTFYLSAVIYLFLTCLQVMGLIPRATFQHCMPEWLWPLDNKTSFESAKAPWSKMTRTSQQVTASNTADNSNQCGENQGISSSPISRSTLVTTEEADEMAASYRPMES